MIYKNGYNLKEKEYDILINKFYGYEEYYYYKKQEYYNDYIFISNELDKINRNVSMDEAYKNAILGWFISFKNSKRYISHIPSAFKITDACQLQCKHCYLQDYKRYNKFMTYEDFICLFYKYKSISKSFIHYKSQKNKISICGGEPTLNPYFLDILKFSLTKFRTIKILSNCVDISEELLDFYKTYKNKIYIKTSIDGLEETHDYNRGSGNYKKTINNIKKLLDSNIDVEVEFAANNKNYNEFSKVYKVLTSIGVDKILCERYMDIHTEYLSKLTEEQTETFLNQADNNLSKRAWGFVGNSTSECTIGTHIIIDQNGNLKPCMKFYNTLINVLQSNVEDIVKELKMTHLKYRVLPQECFDCELAEHCAGGEKCFVANSTSNLYTLDNMCITKKRLKNDIYSYKNLFFAIINKDYNFYTYTNLVRDRFGFFEKEQIHPLPEYNETSLHEVSSKRIKQLGEKNILWSGGIDSTYIICSYIKENIPFTVVCDDKGVTDNLQFYKWMIDRNIPIIKLADIRQSYRIKNMISGHLSDTLFYLDESKHNMVGDIYEHLSQFTNRDELYEKLLEYGKYLNKPTNTNYELIKLINFGIPYLHYANEVNYLIFPNYRIQTFFNTKEFNDIAWTQYWYTSSEKIDMKQFICDITEDSSYMNLQKNPGNIIPRKDLIDKNYYIPLLEYY